MNLDPVDRAALARLMEDGRVSWADLARALGLSPAAAAQRVRRLERSGVIRRYVAVIDPEAVDQPLAAFLGVILSSHAPRRRFLARVARTPSILECHHVTGEFDYLLKVRCAGTRDLERMINEDLKSGAGVAASRTLVVLSTTKETTSLPLTRDPGPRARKGRGA